MRMKRRSTTIRFSLFWRLGCSPGKCSPDRWSGVSVLQFSNSLALPLSTSSVPSVSLSRFTRLFHRSHYALFLSLPPFLVFSIHLERARARAQVHSPRACISSRVVPVSTKMTHRTRGRRARTHACTHVSPSFIRRRPTVMTVLPLGRVFANFSNAKRVYTRRQRARNPFSC